MFTRVRFLLPVILAVLLSGMAFTPRYVRKDTARLPWTAPSNRPS